MKKVTLLFVLFIAFMACNSPVAEDKEAAMQTEDKTETAKEAPKE